MEARRLKSLASLVYGVSPYDALTLAGTIVVIAGGATLMTYAAALRARTVDPLVILADELSFDVSRRRVDKPRLNRAH